MQILDVIAKDVYIITEFSLKELEMIELLLRHADIDFNGTDPKEVEAVEFLHQKYYPFITQSIEAVKKNGVG